MIAIVDYQMGNLRSVQKGFEKVGHDALVTSKSSELLAADKIVLPGVGAFQKAMGELKRRALVGPILKSIDSGKPFLGICLGLQLLFEVGHEAGHHLGLGYFAGEVKRFAVPSGYKVPHMGWNQVVIHQPAPILEGIHDGTYFYFVHSYYVSPRDEVLIATETSYPTPFCSMVWQDNVYATQFHPEKSQQSGLRLLKNFADL